MNARLNHAGVLRAAMGILGLAGLAGVALICAGLTRAQTAPAKTTQAAAQNPTAKKAAPKGQSEGIKVHGHWVIEVKNPDGKVVSHTEFENSYVTAQAVLPNMLSRHLTYGEWGVLLGNSSSSQSPCGALATAPLSVDDSVEGNNLTTNICVISESGPAIGAQNPNATPCLPAAGSCSQNLMVGLNSAQTSIVLSGSVFATNPGTINSVETVISSCGTLLSPTACATETTPDSGSDAVWTFSAASLPAQGSGSCGGTGQPSCTVNITAALQTINVTVTISFQ
jgi:hypothetical protein